MDAYLPKINMKISFLIPSYNHSQFIQYTLDSIVKDVKLLDYEIIVIDDGSTDDSRQVINAWCKKNIDAKIIKIYRENKGLCVTLNELVSKSSGEVVRICASDDGVVLGSSLKILKKFESSLALVIVGDALTIDGQNNIIHNSAVTQNGGNTKKMRQSEYMLKQEIVSNWSIPGPCFAIKKQVYQIVGGYSEDLVVEDWDFFLRVVASCSLCYLNEPIAHYRLHGANACRTQNIDKRILNISSQKIASYRYLNKFKGYLYLMLIKEFYILSAKLFYLKIVKALKLQILINK